MTDAQILQLAGVTLFPMGVAWVVNPKTLRELVRDITNSRGMLLLSGMFAIIVGYLILALRIDGSTVVTILGWIAFVKGLSILILPAAGLKLSSFMPLLRKYFVIMPWLVLFVGVLALYLGFFA